MSNFSHLFRFICAAALALAGGAQANLVTNGGFETGNLSGWTLFGSTIGVSGGGPPHSGANNVFAGPTGTTGGIFQTLSTVAGQTYDISFWLHNVSSGPTNSATFNWDGGAAELSLVNAPSFAYTEYTYSLIATSASTDLRFTFRNDTDFYYLDDVSVNAAAVGSVPEPASIALVGLCLAGAAAATRRRRSD